MSITGVLIAKCTNTSWLCAHSRRYCVRLGACMHPAVAANCAKVAERALARALCHSGGEGLAGMKRFFATLGMCAGLGMVAGCATQPAEGALIADPYVETNRSIHSFNKGVDRAILKPVSEAYDYVTPATVKLLLGNGLDHLRLPGMFVNRVLQGRRGKRWCGSRSLWRQHTCGRCGSA